MGHERPGCRPPGESLQHRGLHFEEPAAIQAVADGPNHGDALAGHRTGLRAHDREATEFAKSAAADSLNDLEILEPTVIMIGDYLRAKLPGKP